jgi:unconventional prefoldin RPB5 interactor 1
MEDLAHLERLKSYEHQILRRNEEETKKKNALRQEYLDLKKKLLSLSDTTRQNVMVPQGKVAYFPGELIHTNEILVLLGDNWFVERSGKQSAEIVQRRIKVIEEQLEQLKKEQENLKSYLKYTNSFADKPEDYKEIKEELPDSKPSKSGKRLAHKSTHSNVPKPVRFDKLKESGKSTFSHEQLFARLNELEEQELEDERKANEEKIRAIQDGEYEPSKISRNVDIDSDDDSDCEGETTNINFHHSSNRVINGQKPPSSEQSYAISSPRDIYERFERHMRKNSNDNNNNRETFRPSHRNSSDAVKRSRSTEEVRRRTHSDGSVQSPPNQSILKTTASKPLKSILKSSSRSNSNENLVPRPILKHSPEHQRSPPDVESVADSVSAVVINEINSRAGVRETDTTIPVREGILKDRESGSSTPSEEMSEDLRSILKMNPTEVDVSKPILKSTNDFDERPNTPEMNDMKPILKHTTR